MSMNTTTPQPPAWAMEDQTRQTALSTLEKVSLTKANPNDNSFNINEVRPLLIKALSQHAPRCNEQRLLRASMRFLGAAYTPPADWGATACRNYAEWRKELEDAINEAREALSQPAPACACEELVEALEKYFASKERYDRRASSQNFDELGFAEHMLSAALAKHQRGKE